MSAGAPGAGDRAATAALGLLEALLSAALDPTVPAATRMLLQRAAERLHASEADVQAERLRYRALFDAVPDPVSVLAHDGTVLDVNHAGIQAYRRTREEIVGKPIEFLNPDLPRGHMVPVLDTLRHGETYVIEVTNMRADGTRFPVEVHSANLVFDGRDALVAVARDLSARREAEIRYRELMETLDKGIIVLAARGDIVSCNAAAMRVFGIHDKTALARGVRERRWIATDEHGRRLPEREWPTARALREGRTIDSRVYGWYEIPTQRMLWLSVTAVPRFDPGQDTPSQVMVLFSDVTDLKRDSAMFERVQALAHIGGWEWDSASGALYLTEESKRVLGQAVPPASMEAMGHCLRTIDRLRLQAAVAAAVQEGRAFELELQGQRADERRFWARAIGEPMRDGIATTRVTGTLQDITESKLSEETLRARARTDPLTGLMNRDAILGEVEARLSDPSQRDIAVLYIDLDRFKLVNDVLGHAAGDEVLVSAARRIVDALGERGLAARFGGDEFLVVCAADGDDPGRVQGIVEAILAAFERSFHYGGEEFAITASIGIAQAPQDGDRPQRLIQNADIAMYDSKRRIRNGWQAFTPALAQTQQERLQVETLLRRAIENEEFHLAYQPQVDLRTGRTLSAEALIRWHNRELGEMRPDRFIAHAENTGDIVRIGGWVLREACRQVARWRDEGLGIVRVAVNVSYRQFLGDDLPATVAALLAEYDLPGSALELELTERVLIEDAPDTVRTIGELRALGVFLSIDDFGEGYSALNYLRRLPIHGLKLSQLFVEGVPDNRSDMAVCQAVAGIARGLGLEVVAEGIESESQRQFLLQLGVTRGQGFLFAPGLSAEEFTRHLPPRAAVAHG